MPIFYQDSEIRTFTINGKVFAVISFSKLNNLKLVWIVLMKKCYWNTNSPIVVHRNILRPIYIYSVIVVILGVKQFIAEISLRQTYKIVPCFYIKIS